MGMFDNIKDKAEGLIHGHGKEVDEAVDKATDAIDDKTGGKAHDMLEKVDEAVDHETDKLDS